MELILDLLLLVKQKIVRKVIIMKIIYNIYPVKKN